MKKSHSDVKRMFESMRADAVKKYGTDAVGSSLDATQRVTGVTVPTPSLSVMTGGSYSGPRLTMRFTDVGSRGKFRLTAEVSLPGQAWYSATEKSPSASTMEIKKYMDLLKIAQRWLTRWPTSYETKRFSDAKQPVKRASASQALKREKKKIAKLKRKLS